MFVTRSGAQSVVPRATSEHCHQSPEGRASRHTRTPLRGSAAPTSRVFTHPSTV